MYCRPGQNDSRAMWRQLFQQSNPRDKVVYVGDFNAYNTVWNCHHTDINGDQLIEEVDRAGLYVVNEDTKTHVGDARSQDSQTWI